MLQKTGWIVLLVLSTLYIGCAARYTGVPRGEKVVYFAEWRYDFAEPYVDERVMRTRFTPGAQFWFNIIADNLIGGGKEIKDPAQIVDKRVAQVRESERDVPICVTESGNCCCCCKRTATASC